MQPVIVQIKVYTNDTSRLSIGENIPLNNQLKLFK